MLRQRLQRWRNIKTTLGERVECWFDDIKTIVIFPTYSRAGALG